MKTLQEWIRETPYDSIAVDGGKPELRTYYEKLAQYEGTVVNDDCVLYLRRLNNVPDNIPDLCSTSIFSISEDEEILPGVAYIPWNEVLGYRVSDTSVEDYGIGTVLNTILRSMTFFGTEAADAERARQKLEACYEKVKDLDTLGEVIDTLCTDERERQLYLTMFHILTPDPKDDDCQQNGIRAWLKEGEDSEGEPLT